jgi:hypothetical protein
VVDKPPSTVADPPQRIRLEAAAMESSLDTFSTQDGVPLRRLPSVAVSGEGRVPSGEGGASQLRVRATPSRRRLATIFVVPYPQLGHH